MHVDSELQLVKKVDKVTNVLLHTYCTSTMMLLKNTHYRIFIQQCKYIAVFHEYYVSIDASVLIPRPSLSPVFDHLQYVNIELALFPGLSTVKYFCIPYMRSRTGWWEGMGTRLGRSVHV